jgi:peptidoglycan hydrolase CwlO-like protein
MYKELFTTLFINGVASVIYYYMLNELEYRFAKKDSQLCYIIQRIKRIEHEIDDLKNSLDTLEQDIKIKNKETEVLRESHLFLNKNLQHYININYDTIDQLEGTDDFYIKPVDQYD